MEEMDKNEVSHDNSDDDLLMQEVVQDDADLYFLHHYLSEVFRKG